MIPRIQLSVFFIFSFLATFYLVADSLVIDDNIYHLKLDEQETIINDLMSRYPHAVSTSKPWLDEHDAAWRELDMNLLIQKLDRTVTVVGKNRFKELIKPLADVDELEQRRTIVKYLIDNNFVHKALESRLAAYNNHEWLLMSLFDPRDAWYEYLNASKMFTKNYGTNDRWLAGSFTRTRQLSEIPTTLGLMCAQIISFPDLRKRVAHQLKKDEPFSWKKAQKDVAMVTALVGGMGWFVYAFYLLHRDYERILFTNAAVRTFHALLINLATVIDQAEAVAQLLPPECATVHAALQEWQDCLTLQSPTYCADLHELVTLLQSDNFKGTPSANIGTSFRHIWQAYEYTLRCKEKLVPLMHIYGTADAYLSVVRLYKESQAHTVPLQWVEFTQNETPSCTLENVYNPLVAPEYAVPNSCVLGGSAIARHMMLTGPHGCGKTTWMKTIAYFYVMSQSMLLGQADKAVIVPINKIGTYLNITDNLAQGMSSFMAEKKRMKELRAMAENLAPQDRCLMLIDEPYAKTLQVVGEDRVYRFVADLYKIPQLMMLVATHFEKPAILENESQGIVENYQPELLEPTPGNFVRTFRILKGKATWWFENAQRRSDFVDWLGEVGT